MVRAVCGFLQISTEKNKIPRRRWFHFVGISKTNKTIWKLLVGSKLTGQTPATKQALIKYENVSFNQHFLKQ